MFIQFAISNYTLKPSKNVISVRIKSIAKQLIDFIIFYLHI
jgi:hypothetical protein